MCFTYYESFKNPEKKKIRNEEISNVTRLSTIDDRKFEKKEEKKETLFFFSQANRLFDKLVIRHRLPLRSIFFFDFHLKTTSGVHDSSLSPPLSSSSLPPPHLFSSLQTRSNYVGSSLAIFLKISGREYLI